MRFRWAAVAATAIVTATAAGCSDDAAQTTSSTTLPAEAAKAPESFFGVVPQAPLTAEDVARMGQGKVGSIRIVVPWQSIAPTGPKLDTYWFDLVVVEAAQAGINVIPTLSGTPDWVAKKLNGDQGCTTECPNSVPRTAAALAAWKSYVGQMVDRYGPGGSLWDEHPELTADPIHDWQIWNEENSPTFNQPKPDPAVYAQLLSNAAEPIHSRDPDSNVILGGMFISPLQGKRPAYLSWDYLRRLYAIPGTADDFDGVAVHPYAAHLDKVAKQVRLMRNEIERAGDDASLWITEVGVSSSDGTNPLERGIDGQADELRQEFDYLLSKRKEWDIRAVTWFSWRDTAESQCDWCAQSGLFPVDSLDDPKPAWDTFVSYTGGS